MIQCPPLTYLLAEREYLLLKAAKKVEVQPLMSRYKSIQLLVVAD